MAKLIGHVMGVVGDPTRIDTTKLNPLGTRTFDDAGNEYIYLGGVASLALGDWVVFNSPAAASPFLTVRLVSTPLIGPIAVAGAAILAGQFGWFQIWGLTPATTNIATASSDGLQLYQSATPGRATSTAAATKCIFGAVSIGNAASNAGAAFLTYPSSTGNSTL